MADDETVGLFFLVIIGVPIGLVLIAHRVFGSRWKAAGKESERMALKYGAEDDLWYRYRSSGLPESRIRSRSNPNFGKTPEGLQVVDEAKVKIAAADPRMAFDTTTSVLVYERITETFGGLGRSFNLMAHRIYRNESGEYFLVIASRHAEPTYVKHLPREQAMNAFRDDPEAFRKEFGDGGR